LPLSGGDNKGVLVLKKEDKEGSKTIESNPSTFSFYTRYKNFYLVSSSLKKYRGVMIPQSE
jgi:hypothetical protein